MIFLINSCILLNVMLTTSSTFLKVISMILYLIRPPIVPCHFDKYSLFSQKSVQIYVQAQNYFKCLCKHSKICQLFIKLIVHGHPTMIFKNGDIIKCLKNQFLLFDFSVYLHLLRLLCVHMTQLVKAGASVHKLMDSKLCVD